MIALCGILRGIKIFSIMLSPGPRKDLRKCVWVIKLLLQESRITEYFEFEWIFCCYLLGSEGVSWCKVFKFRTGLVFFFFFWKVSENRTGIGEISCFHVKMFVNYFFLVMFHLLDEFLWMILTNQIFCSRACNGACRNPFTVERI